MTPVEASKEIHPPVRYGSCRACGASLDPFCAPVLGIVETRVLTFCSKTCKERVLNSAVHAAAVEKGGGGRVDPASALKGIESGVRGDGIRGDGIKGGARGDDGGGSGDQSFAQRWSGGGILTAAVVCGGGLVLAGLSVLGFVLVLDGWAAHAKGIGGSKSVFPQLALQAAEEVPLARMVPRAKTVRPLSLLKARRRARQILEHYLKHESTRNRLMAAEALARCCNHKKAWQTLLRCAADTLWTRRQQAAAALARLGNGHGFAVLKKGLRSPRRTVRWGSAFTLARLGDDSGAEVIRPLLRRERYRVTCAEALIKTGDTEARRVLLRMLNGVDIPSSYRLRAAVALGLVGDRSGKSLLEHALRTEGVHLGAALALLELGDKSAVGVLIKALEHSAARLKAARALSRLGCQAGIGLLVERMHHFHHPGRVSAAAAVMLLTREARAEAH